MCDARVQTNQKINAEMWKYFHIKCYLWFLLKFFRINRMIVIITRKLFSIFYILRALLHLILTYNMIHVLNLQLCSKCEQKRNNYQITHAIDCRIFFDLNKNQLQRILIIFFFNMNSGAEEERQSVSKNILLN